ncbi:MAG TPA: TIGR00282 family metallophosphoesterase [Candidatus Saccharimonadia bacterium]
MKLLYIGDIMGRPGRNTVKTILPGLKRERGIDFVVAQGENLSHGKGLTPEHAQAMFDAGVDALTSGDWTLNREEIYPWLEDPSKPLTRPANYPAGTPGRGYKIVKTPHGNVLIASLLGQTVGYRQPENLQNPLTTIDQILKDTQHEALVARLVNFHGDYSSEKLVIGQYLDGRVSAVIGDHWHVPTADARVLPGGTAHITDVGMVGSRDSSLGIQSDIIIKRWLTDERSRNELENGGSKQFCAVMIDVDIQTGLAQQIEQILIFVEE